MACAHSTIFIFTQWRVSAVTLTKTLVGGMVSVPLSNFFNFLFVLVLMYWILALYNIQITEKYPDDQKIYVLLIIIYD